MGKWIDTFRAHSAEEKRLFQEHSEELSALNAEMLWYISLCFCAIMAAMMLFSIIVSEFATSMAVYIFSLAISVAVAVFVRLRSKQYSKAVLPVMYLFAVGLFGVCIYLNSAIAPYYPNLSFTCFIILCPIAIMDRTWRINIFLLLCVLISAVASLIYKTPSIALVDIATSCTFALLGIVVGKHIRSVKLANISQNRQLIIQRDTDALTRLLNRRRLFEVLEEHTGEAVNSFTGIMMIDIDEFKVYNDFYGHQKGDECLRKLGECFAEFGRKHELTFFRYGGEEFTALSRSYSYQGLEEAARKLREAVHALHIPTEVSSHAIVTISIGFAEAEACQCYQYEKLLCMSDQALFYVKSNGRDRAMGYLEYRHVSDSIK